MISDSCVECGESTALGKGRFVNRVSVGNGWLCPDCYAEKCDKCGELASEYEYQGNGDTWCWDCVTKYGKPSPDGFYTAVAQCAVEGGFDLRRKV